jgi:3-oxoacyl-[acyl-carrier-protein] synthase I
VRAAISPVILGVGARSPLGLSALQVTMSARALRLEPRSTDFRDRKGYWIGAARAECLDDAMVGWERFAALGAPALREAASGQTGRFPLIVALPDRARPDQSGRFDDALISELARRSGAAIDQAASTTVRADNAGFALALDEAAMRLAAGAPGVIVGGLDSYFDPVVLAFLDEERRLHSEHSDSGFVPSEGAAFFWIGRADARIEGDPARAPRPLAVISRLEIGREETVVTGEPNLGAAMTELSRRAIAGAVRPVSWLVTDVNGERHRVREHGAVEMHLADDLAKDHRHDALPAALGEVGAATGALHLALVTTLFRVGAAPARSALLLSSSEGAERAAMLVEQVA